MISDGNVEPSEARHLIQRLIDGHIPRGADFDTARQVLRDPPDEQAALDALFTLLQGAVADPFFDLEDSARVVSILKALARRGLAVRALL